MLLIPFSKQTLLLIAINKAPIATFNAIVIKSLLTKECAAFSNVSVLGVHTENGSFSKRTVFKRERGLNQVVPTNSKPFQNIAVGLKSIQPLINGVKSNVLLVGRSAILFFLAGGSKTK